MSGGEMIGRILETLPVGVGFHPTDEQLVVHYLIPKIRGTDSDLKMKIPGNDSQVDVIPEVDVCKSEPWELPAKLDHPVFSKFKRDEHEQEWFFFSRLHKKYANGRQFNRATNDGFWKPTGPDCKIKRRVTEDVIGNKKILVFRKGRGHSAVSTPWVIHEYHAVMPSLPANKTYYVLCRLKRETGSGFPPQTNLNGMLPKLPFNQGTWLVDMEVDDSSTGTGIHVNGPPNIMTSGADRSHSASNIASDIRNYLPDDMTPEEHALPDEPLWYELVIDSDGYPYEKLIPQRRSAAGSGKPRHCYIDRLSTCPQAPLKGAYGKGDGSSSDTDTQVAQDGKGSFNFPDTASAGHEQSSSPGYLVNLLVGILLVVILVAVMVQDIRAKFSKP